MYPEAPFPTVVRLLVPQYSPRYSTRYYNGDQDLPSYKDNLLGKLLINKETGQQGMYLGGKKQKKQKKQKNKKNK